MTPTYSSSTSEVSTCANQCGVEVVITSRAFVERFPNLAIPGRTLLLEDALAAPRFSEKLPALVLAWLVPSALLRGALGASHAELDSSRVPGTDGRAVSPVDRLATVIFCSGSTGDLKGVMLTHFNIVSNIRQVRREAIDPARKDDTTTNLSS